ncbi:MAG: PAS domain S-box protein, partial [Anaerolineae bacterium]
MPFLFWLDIATLSVCTVVAASLALMVLGAGPRRALNRAFTIFVLIEATWAVLAIFLRVSLWLEMGNPALLLELDALATILMGPFLLMFTVRYLGRRARRADLAAIVGLVVMVVLCVPLFRHQLVFNPYLDVNGITISGISTWAFVLSPLPALYMVWSLLLFWQERHRIGEPYFALSVLILLLGFIVGGVLFVRFPVTSIATTLSIATLGYGVVSRQLFNPLRELTEELERKVEARTRDLEKAYAQVEERVEERTAELKQEIADRQRAEDALRASEERFRSLVETVGDWIWEIDSNGAYTYVSPKVKDLLGYEPENVIGKTPLDFMFPDRAKRVAGFFQARVKSAKPFSGIVHTALHKDGRGVEIETSGVPILDANGSLLGYRGVARDVTERKQAEKTVRERATRLELIARVGQRTTAILKLDELLHQAVNLISDAFGFYNSAILLVDNGDVVLRAVTLTALRALEGRFRLRVGVEGIIGWVAGSGEPLLVPDVSLEPRYRVVWEETETKSELAVPIILKEIVIGVLNAESAERDAFSQADVSTLQAIADQLAIAIENARLYEAAQREIAERKRAEEGQRKALAETLQATHALRESEERYRQSVENSPNPIFSVNRDGMIQMWNPACEKVFQYGPDIIGQNYGKLLLNPEDRPVVESRVARVFRKHPLGDLDMYYKCKDGTERVMISRLYSLLDGAGEVQSCVFANT